MNTDYKYNMSHNGGFTVIELLIVIAVLGIIAAIVIMRIFGQSDGANRSRILTDLRTLDQSVQMYMNKYPTTPSMQDLVTAGLIIEQPTAPGTPDVSYMSYKITSMSYILTNSIGTGEGNGYRARLSGSIYMQSNPSGSKNASLFTIEQLIDGGW